MGVVVLNVALMALRIFMLAAGIACCVIIGWTCAVLLMEDDSYLDDELDGDGTDEEGEGRHGVLVGQRGDFLSAPAVTTRSGHPRFLAQPLWDHIAVWRVVAGSKRTA